ncbi:conserved hypothetical protein [Cupriavidus taiwanensis]|nr:conserved hypothetical protein [Cupriavidus taiwanensis]SPA44493.1 conserved hypothetical protein [Cupriavidus taiwanensis]
MKRFEFCQVHRRGVQMGPDGRDLKEGGENERTLGELLVAS